VRCGKSVATSTWLTELLSQENAFIFRNPQPPAVDDLMDEDRDQASHVSCRIVISSVDPAPPEVVRRGIGILGNKHKRNTSAHRSFDIQCQRLRLSSGLAIADRRVSDNWRRIRRSHIHSSRVIPSSPSRPPSVRNSIQRYCFDVGETSVEGR